MVPTEVLWKFSETKGLHIAFIQNVKDIYYEVKTSCENMVGEGFFLTIRLHQGQL